MFTALVRAMHVFQGAELALNHGKKGQKDKEGSHGPMV